MKSGFKLKCVNPSRNKLHLINLTKEIKTYRPHNFFELYQDRLSGPLSEPDALRVRTAWVGLNQDNILASARSPASSMNRKTCSGNLVGRRRALGDDAAVVWCEFTGIRSMAPIGRRWHRPWAGLPELNETDTRTRSGMPGRIRYRTMINRAECRRLSASTANRYWVAGRFRR